MIAPAIGLVALALAVLAAVTIVVYSLRLGITPTPTSGKARRRILELLPQDLAGTVLELGAGWGGLASLLSRRFPTVRVVAYERSPVPFLVAWLRARLGRRRNLDVRCRDFRRESLTGAAAVVCYLFTGAMAELAGKLPGELPPGTPVVSHAFRIPGWTPEREISVPGIWPSTTYLYRIPGAAAEATCPRDAPC